MARRKIELPSLLNVAAGATSILQIPVGGLTYEQIHFQFTNVSDTEVTNIRVKLNGEEIQFYENGATLEDINDYYGRPNTANFLSLYFARPEMADLVRERATAIGTANLQTFTIEMDLDAGVVSPAIEAWAIVSEPTNLGAFTRVRRFPFNFGASGQVEMTGITLGPAIMAMHLQKADVDDVLIQDSSRSVINLSKAVAEHIQEGYGRVPVNAAFTHVDFILEGDPAQALQTSATGPNGVTRAKDLRFQPTLGTSGQVDAYVEYLDSLS